MSVFHEFDDVDKFTVGTEGRPGARTFFLQLRAEGTRLAVKCEKQQAAAIAQYLSKVLADLPPAEDRPIPGAMELTQPLDPVFVLGPIGLGYDRSNDRVLLQLEEVGEVDENGEMVEDGDVRGHVRVYLTRGQAAAFTAHADQVIESGRVDCQWCNNPMDPDGHVCPRMN
ncbi:MAG: putative repeat protein (TIGR03847 family) [Candidatus Aldehydirespiratoraceae bacterium]|jgi:uncharacterized repeat protein (TIGR03847 family)